MAGFQLGSAIGLTLSPILMSQGGIYGPFIIFGSFGFLWVLVWLSATSSTPDKSSQISKFELDYIQSKMQRSVTVESKTKTSKVIPPFRLLLSKMPTWSIIVANAMHSWVILNSPLLLLLYHGRAFCLYIELNVPLLLIRFFSEEVNCSKYNLCVSMLSCARTIIILFLHFTSVVGLVF